MIWQEFPPSNLAAMTSDLSPRGNHRKSLLQSTKVYATRGDCRANVQTSKQSKKQINKADTPTDPPAQFFRSICTFHMALL
jgi:hypothetical protein